MCTGVDCILEGNVEGSAVDNRTCITNGNDNELLCALLLDAATVMLTRHGGQVGMEETSKICARRAL